MKKIDFTIHELEIIQMLTYNELQKHYIYKNLKELYCFKTIISKIDNYFISKGAKK